MKPPVENNAKIYTDVQGLNKLKNLAKQQDGKAVKQVAQQFEALFLQTILKNMRAGNKALGANLLGSHQLETYNQLHDHQLALSLSGSGIGLADQIAKHIETQFPLKNSPKTNDKTTEGSPDVAGKLDPADWRVRAGIKKTEKNR